ncbi:MAG TPA: hypothetical protein VFJ16_19315 [Longimicrobium sp.]|nr:hypothetical protein [Longimicrobium sp.]
MLVDSPTTPALARHTVRQSILEPEQTFTLFPGRLVVEAEGRPPAAYDLASVERVHLTYDRSKQREYYHCRITAGGRQVKLRHVHFAGPLNFEDRRATYTPFVLQLLQQLEGNPNVRLTSGAWISFIGLLVLLPFILGLIYFAASIGRWGYAAAAGVLLLVLLTSIGRIRPRNFTAGQPPRGLLPV